MLAALYRRRGGVYPHPTGCGQELKKTGAQEIGLDKPCPWLKSEIKHPAAARTGINPAPTVDMCNSLIISVLPTYYIMSIKI